MVRGLTSQECGELIELRLRDGYLVDPQVTVSIAEYGARPIRVLGEVESPGVYYLMGDTSILGMLARAGGAPENVTRGRIVRESNGVVQTIEIDLERDVLNTDGSRAVLMSGDTLQLLAPAIVFVSGEVEDEGAVPWRDGMTAWQALTRAGGPTRTAKLRAVYVLRDGETIEVDMNDVAEGREADVVLRPNDQIVVPESMF
jgi:polysaccharide export outer membrane protein